MALVQRTELLVTLDQIFDVLLLVLDHQPTSSSHGHDDAARKRGSSGKVDWTSEPKLILACAPPAGDGGNCGCGLRSISIMDSLFALRRPSRNRLATSPPYS